MPFGRLFAFRFTRHDCQKFQALRAEQATVTPEPSRSRARYRYRPRSKKCAGQPVYPGRNPQKRSAMKTRSLRLLPSACLRPCLACASALAADSFPSKNITGWCPPSRRRLRHLRRAVGRQMQKYLPNKIDFIYRTWTPPRVSRRSPSSTRQARRLHHRFIKVPAPSSAR